MERTCETCICYVGCCDCEGNLDQCTAKMYTDKDYYPGDGARHPYQDNNCCELHMTVEEFKAVKR